VGPRDAADGNTADGNTADGITADGAIPLRVSDEI
jgi:hypothetical protein